MGTRRSSEWGFGEEGETSIERRAAMGRRFGDGAARRVVGDASGALGRRVRPDPDREMEMGSGEVGGIVGRVEG